MNTILDSKITKLVKHFNVVGKDITYFNEYGEGHINETYILVMDNVHQYIFQKINTTIFPNVEMLMNNIQCVTSFLSKQIKESGGNPLRETLSIVMCEDGKSYYCDPTDGSAYRMYLFVTNSVTLNECSNAELFKESAIGFASFVKRLKGFDVSCLGEIIKDFHNTKKRFEHFKETLQKDPLRRSGFVKNEIEFVLKRENECSIIIDAINEGLIPLRVTHNDTKLNNILFDNNSMKPLCVIDLDTVMPGSLLYDFGDSIRFGCNPAGENEIDLSKVVFRMDYFKSYVDGYLSVLGSTINEKEKELLAFSAKLMTLECGIRFLDDYLDGDHYFKTKNPDDNLIRARTQFKLVSDMELLFEDMNNYILSK